MLQKYLVINEADSIELKLYDTIGAGIFNDGITAQSIIDQIEQANPSSITVRINSGGGSVFEGLAIFNYLKSFKGRKKVIVDGYAASIASIIAMAGDVIEMGEGTLLMVHDPLLGIKGNAREMRAAADFLDKVGGEMANIYMNKTGLPKEKVLELMAAETWLTAQEALDLGFATKAKGVKANKIDIMNVAASIGANKVINYLTPIKMENKSFVEQIKDFFTMKKEIDTLQNEMNAPIVNEYEAQLQAERDAKAALKAELESAQAIAAQVADLQAKLDAMKASAAPIEQPAPEPTEQGEAVAEPTQFEKLENSLRNLMPKAKLAEAEKAMAMVQRIAEIQNKRKNS